jgi:hypothetical protein
MKIAPVMLYSGGTEKQLTIKYRELSSYQQANNIYIISITSHLMS